MKMKEQTSCHLDVLTLHKWILALKMGTIQQNKDEVQKALQGLFDAQEKQAKEMELDKSTEEEKPALTLAPGKDSSFDK
jgi:hypothetical protein